MTIPAALSIRLKTSMRDVHITDIASDIDFGSASPNGYTDCTVKLHKSLAFMPLEIVQFGRMYVYDSHGSVWEGRMQDPGRTAGSDGQVWEIAAVGGSAHLGDSTIPYILVDRDLTQWVKDRGAAGEMQSTTVSVSQVSGLPILMLNFPAGLTVPTNAACTAIYWPIQNAGQQLAVFDYSWDAGVTNGSWELHGLSDSTHVVRVNTANTAGGGNSTAIVGVTTNFALGDDLPYVQLQWTSAPSGTGGSDSVWASFHDLVVVAIRYNQDGTQKTSGYSTSDKTILASTVVADWLGRRMTSVWDTPNATIVPTTFAIDQLAYPDGVDGVQLFADMLAIENAFTWHVWGSNPDNDKFKFEWVPWPTSVRYEVDINDGFTAPSSGSSLFDQVQVRYKFATGFAKHVLRTQVVPELAAAGFDRLSWIDLGSEVGSSAAAAQVGDQFLADHMAPVNAGTLTITHPIVDLQYGRMVKPWEIRAGNLIRVHGVESYPNALNPSSRDGLTVFKIAATHYSSAAGATTCELDSYTPTVSRALAKLVKKPYVRRR